MTDGCCSLCLGMIKWWWELPIRSGRSPELEPQALDSEIEFILNTAGRYMSRKPQRSDVLSVFAGLRPLAAPKKEGKSTKEISRSHKIFVSKNKLVTITGGKWTTYRKMAEDTVDKVIGLGLLEKESV